MDIPNNILSIYSIKKSTKRNIFSIRIINMGQKAETGFLQAPLQMKDLEKNNSLGKDTSFNFSWGLKSIV